MFDDAGETRKVKPNPLPIRRTQRLVPLSSLLLAPGFIWILVFMLGPLFMLGRLSFDRYVPNTGIISDWQFGNYLRSLTDPQFRSVFLNTMLLGVEVTVLSILLGYPLAMALARSVGWPKALLYFAIVLPLLTSAVVKTFGWMILLGNHGVINQLLQAAGVIQHPLKLMYTMTGAVLALTQVLLPFMVLALTAALEGIDPSIPNAARNLGAGRLRVFFQLTVPLSLPGLVSGAILVFMLAISAFVTPQLVGGPTVKVMAVAIYDQSMTLLNWPLGGALSFVVLFAILVLLLISLRVTRGRVAA